MNIYTIRINLKNYVKRNNKQYLKKFPGASNCKDYFSLGYRDMCKFFANDVFYDQHFDDSEYFIRMDTDSFFLNVRKIFINQLLNLNSDYAYLKNTIQYEDKSVTLGFGHCLYEFIRKEKNLKNPKEYNLKICTQATLKPKIFYRNLCGL